MDTRTMQIPLAAAAAVLLSGGLALPAAAQLQDGEFPPEWFHGTPEQRAKHAELVGKEAPELELADWMNVEELDLELEDGFQWEDLEGKVVLVDYWATW